MMAPATRTNPFALRSWGRAIGPALMFLGLSLVPIAATAGSTQYFLSIATRVVILALGAMSLDLLIGYAGLVSFGHAAYFGIGSYAVGILTACGVTDGAAQILAAVVVAAVFAAVTGAVAIRTRGVYFIMITLAFGQMLFFVTTSLADFGGDDGMTLAERSHIAGRDVLASDVNLYYVALGTLLVVYLILRRVVASRFGRVIAGARENEVRLEAIGFQPYAYRLLIYVVSGVVAALAGCLLANQADFVSPATMTWQRSGELIFMVVIGGAGSLHGAILGSVVFLLIEEGLSNWTEHWPIVFGPLLIASVFFARNGLSSLWRSGARS